MHHCSPSLYVSILSLSFLRPSACWEARDDCSPVFIRVSTSMSHLIIVTNIIGSANYQIVDYPFPKMPSIQFLTSRMYILHSRKWSYLYACTTIQKSLPRPGSAPCQTAFPVRTILSVPTYWFSLHLPFLKNLLLSTVKYHNWAIPSFFEPFSGQSSS